MVSLEEDEFEAQPKKIKFFRRYIQLLFHQFDIQFRFYFFNENCPLTFIHKSEGSRQYSTTQKSNKIIKCLYMTATMFIWCYIKGYTYRTLWNEATALCFSRTHNEI